MSRLHPKIIRVSRDGTQALSNFHKYQGDSNIQSRLRPSVLVQTQWFSFWLHIKSPAALLKTIRMPRFYPQESWWAFFFFSFLTDGDSKMQSGLRTTTRNQWRLTTFSKNMAVLLPSIGCHRLTHVCSAKPQRLSYEMFSENTLLDILRIKLSGGIVSSFRFALLAPVRLAT